MRQERATWHFFQNEVVHPCVWVRKHFSIFPEWKFDKKYGTNFSNSDFLQAETFLWKLMAKFRRMEKQRRSKYLMETVVIQLSRRDLQHSEYTNQGQFIQ